jgi:hypothetical protein
VPCTTASASVVAMMSVALSGGSSRHLPGRTASLSPSLSAVQNFRPDAARQNSRSTGRLLGPPPGRVPRNLTLDLRLARSKGFEPPTF